MPIATIISIIEALASLAPQIPELIAGVETTIGLISSGSAPTAAQQAQIDAMLEAAHNALQNAQQGA